ncbi:MAG: hypothetical protein KJZ84_19530 [Bryobacteraceae bacterium]|nr:hypothetical protein [Bryobacteraceae bacterium]
MTERWLVCSRRGLFLALAGTALAGRIRAEEAEPGDAAPPLEQLPLGALVELHGVRPGAGGFSAAAGEWPELVEVEGLRVRFNGHPAPVFALGEDRLLVQVPFEAGPGRVRIEIEAGEEVHEDERELTASAPRFVLDAAGAILAVRHGDEAVAGVDTLPRHDEWWRIWTTGADREWFPIATGEASPWREEGEPYVCVSELEVDGEPAVAGGLEWVPGLTGVQAVTFLVNQPRGIHEIRVKAPGGDGVPGTLAVRADDEPLLQGSITPTDDKRHNVPPRTYHVTITHNDDTEETTARNNRYLTYFPGKPVAESPIETLVTSITNPETYPLVQPHAIEHTRDTTIQHITIPRLNDPRETLRLNPDATDDAFMGLITGMMFTVDPAAALDLREYLIAGWRKGMIENFHPVGKLEHLNWATGMVSMYNGRWWQQLPFKIYMNPDGTATDVPENIGIKPSPQAVDAAAQAMLSWNDAFDNPVIKIVDYDPTKIDSEQGAFVRWGTTGNGASLRVRGPDRDQIPGTDRSLQGIIFLNYLADVPDMPISEMSDAAAHEVGHLLFGLAHRRFRGIMRGVGSPGTRVPDPIEYAAAKANYSFPGLFDHVQGRLARIGYHPARIDDFDYPYFYPIENGIVVQRPELIDRERWYGA